MSRISWVRMAAAGLVGMWSVSALGGPLAPPAGPIGPTYRTLSEIESRIPLNATTAPGNATEVFRITLDGSYFLTGDIVVPSGMTGIMVASPNVTIDMRGHTIWGNPGSVHGIADQQGATRMRVFNGNFTGLGQSGLYGNFAQGSIYSNLTATGCGLRGLSLASGSVGENLTAVQNQQGIFAGSNVTLVGCTALSNTGFGILLNDGSVAERCVSSGNGSSGFRLVAGAMVRGCGARSNAGDGFALGSYSQAIECVSSFNQGHGFVVNTSGGSDFSAVVRRCLATKNTLSGIRTPGGRALIDENVSRENLGAGIDVSLGIGVPSTVTRNICGGNGVNSSISAGNRVAPIVQPVGSGTISGNTGGTAFSTDSMANIAE